MKYMWREFRDSFGARGMRGSFFHFCRTDQKALLMANGETISPLTIGTNILAQETVDLRDLLITIQSRASIFISPNQSGVR